MRKQFSKLLDASSEFFASRKGLLPILGMALVGLNFILQFLPGSSFIKSTDLFLHAGILLGTFGILLGRAL